MPIITLGDYMTYAGITGTGLDTRLQVLIDATQDAFERLAGRRFDLSTYTDIIDGHETGVLIVRNPPISGTVTIATVRPDGTTDTVYTGTVTAGQLVDAPGVKIDAENGTIELAHAAAALAVAEDWPMARAAVIAPSWRSAPLWYSVTYIGGYATAPASLKLAMYEMVGTALSVALRRGDMSMRSETLGNYSYTTLADPEVNAVMERHARAWRRRWS